jgi:hypothetical protein
MTENKVRVMGWKAICYVMDYSMGAWRNCKEELEKHNLLRYNGNRPYVILSEVEAFFKRK